jgi:hypothetical protein
MLTAKGVAKLNATVAHVAVRSAPSSNHLMMVGMLRYCSLAITC